MEITGTKRLLFFAAIAVTAFLSNFCWESLHGLLYEGHPGMAASDYVPMMLSMALMDTLGISALYALTALVSGRWIWSLDVRNSSFFFLSALAAAYGVEYVALFKSHTWQYSSSMPLLFGVGLFPLIQLSITGLFSVFVACKVAGNQ
ncbi:MAG: hypothetical protein HGB23_12130 [Chlorobiaceae bacterium]|nr:hypothetical protein [Chlorobiaceae bacterium]